MAQLRSLAVGQSTADALFKIDNTVEPYASSLIKKLGVRHLWRTSPAGKMESLGVTFAFGYTDVAGDDVLVCTLKFAGTTTENIQDGVLERVEWSPDYQQQ